MRPVIHQRGQPRITEGTPVRRARRRIPVGETALRDLRADRGTRPQHRRAIPRLVHLIQAHRPRRTRPRPAVQQRHSHAQDVGLVHRGSALPVDIPVIDVPATVVRPDMNVVQRVVMRIRIRRRHIGVVRPRLQHLHRRIDRDREHPRRVRQPPGIQIHLQRRLAIRGGHQGVDDTLRIRPTAHMRVDRRIFHRPARNHRLHRARGVDQRDLLGLPVQRRGQAVQPQRKRPTGRGVHRAQDQRLLQTRQRSRDAHIRRPPHVGIGRRRPLNRGRGLPRASDPERQRRVAADLHRRQPRVVRGVRDVGGVFDRGHPVAPCARRHQGRVDVDQLAASVGEPLRHRIDLCRVSTVGIDVLIAPHRPPPGHLDLPRLRSTRHRRNRRSHRPWPRLPQHRTTRHRPRLRELHRTRRLRHRGRHRPRHRRDHGTGLVRRRCLPRLGLRRGHLRVTARRTAVRALRQRHRPERIHQRRRPARTAPGYPQHHQPGQHQHRYQPE